MRIYLSLLLSLTIVPLRISGANAESISQSAAASFSASGATSMSVTLKWIAPGDDGKVGTASQYDIRYSTATITADNFSSAPKTASAPTPKIAGSAESFVVTGLSAGTTYFFALKTADEVPNWAVISNVVSRATLGAAPTAPALIFPVDLPHGILYDMKPEFVWSSSQDPNPGDTVRYRLELATDPGFLHTRVIDSLTQNRYTLPDSLEFNEQYWWRVKAFDKTNVMTMSGTKDFWTWTLGDVDYTHTATMNDLTILLDHLFITLTPLDPMKTGDLDGDCFVTMSDLTVMIDYLFISLNPLTVTGCE
jgi:phosphodiesterase/alkaline phosphatase D-like protein